MSAEEKRELIKKLQAELGERPEQVINAPSPISQQHVAPRAAPQRVLATPSAAERTQSSRTTPIGSGTSERTAQLHSARSGQGPSREESPASRGGRGHSAQRSRSFDRNPRREEPRARLGSPQGTETTQPRDSRGRNPSHPSFTGGPQDQWAPKGPEPVCHPESFQGLIATDDELFVAVH